MKNNKNLMIGIIIVIAVVILFFYISSNKGVEQQLTDNDFKIISASWDNFQKEYDETKKRFVSTSEEIDWDFLCSNEPFETKSVSYTLITQQAYDLSCYYIINGEVKREYYKGNEISKVFEKDRIDYGGSYNLNYKQNNEMGICCSLSFKEGEVCKSITLPAKC